MNTKLTRWTSAGKLPQHFVTAFSITKGCLYQFHYTSMNTYMPYPIAVSVLQRLSYWICFHRNISGRGFTVNLFQLVLILPSSSPAAVQVGATEGQCWVIETESRSHVQATTVTSTGFLLEMSSVYRGAATVWILQLRATFHCIQPMSVSCKLLLSTPGWNPLWCFLLRDKLIMVNLFPNNFIGETTGLRCFVLRLFPVVSSLWDSLCITPA